MRTIDAELASDGSLVGRGTFFTHPWLERPWVAVAVRILGIALLMAGLAAVGAVSILSGVQQGELVGEATGAQANIAGGWLAVSRGAHPSSSAPARGAASASASAAARSKKLPPRSPGITEDGKVVLNVATAAELTRLPGVGEKRAEAIVALRKRLGRFKRATDLLRIRGIGPVSLQKMRPYFVLDPPPDSEKKKNKKK